MATVSNTSPLWSSVQFSISITIIQNELISKGTDLFRWLENRGALSFLRRSRLSWDYFDQGGFFQQTQSGDYQGELNWNVSSFSISGPKLKVNVELSQFLPLLTNVSQNCVSVLEYTTRNLLRESLLSKLNKQHPDLKSEGPTDEDSGLPSQLLAIKAQ